MDYLAILAIEICSNLNAMLVRIHQYGKDFSVELSNSVVETTVFEMESMYACFAYLFSSVYAFSLDCSRTAVSLSTQAVYLVSTILSSVSSEDILHLGASFCLITWCISVVDTAREFSRRLAVMNKTVSSVAEG